MEEFHAVFSEIRELEVLKNSGNRQDILRKLETLKRTIDLTGKLSCCSKIYFWKYCHKDLTISINTNWVTNLVEKPI